MTAKHIIDAVDPEAFMKAWEENEEHMGEQAALAVTCEQFGISYEDAEWVQVVEKVKDA